MESLHDKEDLVPTSDADQVEAIVARLAHAYPGLAETDIRDEVVAAHRAQAGARLRQFVPLLIERDAKAACRRRRARRGGVAPNQVTSGMTEAPAERARAPVRR